jgi:hypothetical protein
VKVSIDSTGLNTGLKAARGYSDRSVPELVNTAAYWVSVNSQRLMPVVRAPKIDSELAVISNPVIGKRGKALKNRKTYTAAPQASATPPLAVMIVAARANPNSRYNQRTNQRYALAKNPFKGVSREAGRAAMRAFVDAMIKMRRSSGGFLAAGWGQVASKLHAFAKHKWMPGKSGAECTVTIENIVGMEGANAASHNAALLTEGAPGLQRAVDYEGKRQMEYALKHFEKELAELVNPLLR